MSQGTNFELRAYGCLPRLRILLHRSHSGRGFCRLTEDSGPYKHIIEVVNAHHRKTFQKKTIECLARNVLSGEGRVAKELKIVFVNDKEIKRLNREFLSHDYITDVISFRLDKDKKIEGEVYINLDQATRQAREYGVDANEEVRRLVVHGILHLVGYKDTTVKKKQVMHTLEDKYLRWKNH